MLAGLVVLLAPARWMGARAFQITDDAAAFSFNLNGSFWGVLGEADQDQLTGDGQVANRSTFKQRANLKFNPEFAGATGWRVGARFDLGMTNRYDTALSRTSLTPPVGRNTPYIDKQYVYLDGAYGRLTAGQVQGVGSSTAYYAPISNEISGINTSALNLSLENSPAFLDPKHYVGRPFTTTTNFSNDSAKIMYFTPRVAGFQFGASYAPSSDPGGFARASANLRFNTAAGIDLAGLSGARPADTIEGAYELGVNFDRLVEGIGVRGSFTYGGARDPMNVAVKEDTAAWNLGLNLSVGDFTLGGAYGYIEGAILGRAYDPTDASTAALTRGRKLERSSFDVGGTYTIADWTLGLNYAYGTASYPVVVSGGLTSRNPVTAGTEFSFDYALMHGVDLVSAVQFINFDAGAVSNERVANKSATNILVGTQIKF